MGDRRARRRSIYRAERLLVEPAHLDVENRHFGVVVKKGGTTATCDDAIKAIARLAMLRALCRLWITESWKVSP
jgi:hypothetical protein